jgi:hypothetical protein
MKTLIIIIIVILIIYFIFFYSNNPKPQTYYIPEGFDTNISSQELEQNYLPASYGIENLVVDTLVCHPKCCGDQWPTPFDGLTADEIKQSIASRVNNNSFIRTNYTCANGENGVGCPCFTPVAHSNLVNHSQNIGSTVDI